MNQGKLRFISLSALLFPLFLVAPESSAATTHTVRILHHSFEPESVFVQPGDTVRWLHQDGAAHTATGNGGETWNSEHMEFGDVYLRVFVNPGSHDYICLYHPMFGKIVVAGSTAINLPSQGFGETSGRFNAGGRDLRDALGRKAAPTPKPFEALIRATPR